MKRAKKLLEEFDSTYAADHYAADKILKKLELEYGNSKNKWINAQIRLRALIIGDAFKRNKKEDIFDEELLTYFEKNNLNYETAAILLTRTNFFLGIGDTAAAENQLNEIREKGLINASFVISFAYAAHLSNLYGRKNEHAQRLSIVLEAMQKLESIKERDSEWYRFFLIFAGTIIEIYLSNEELELATPYVNAALKILEEQTVNETQKTFSRMVIAQYYCAQKDYENATKYYDIAKNSVNKDDYDFIYLNACNSLVREYSSWYNSIPETQKRKRAELLQQIEKNVLELENHKSRDKFPILQVVRPAAKGRLALLQKKYPEAIKQLTIAMENSKKLQINAQQNILGIYRMLHSAYHAWWQETKDSKKLELAYKYSQKVKEIVEAEGKEKIKNKLEAVRGYYELEQKKLNEQLLQQQVESMKKELQMANLHLHEKVMVLDDLKKHIHDLKMKEPKAQQVIRNIDKKIDAVKITEQEKVMLQQKMNEAGKHFSKILAEKYPSLTNHEIQMCALFQTGITDKELAKLYGQTERAYRQQRYRIKKKMGLSGNENLVKHLASLNIEYLKA